MATICDVSERPWSGSTKPKIGVWHTSFTCRVLTYMAELGDGAETHAVELVTATGVNRSSVYTWIRTVGLRRGLVTMTRDEKLPGQGGIPRKWFRLTRLGRAIAAEWAGHTHDEETGAAVTPGDRQPGRQVLATLASEPDRERYGHELAGELALDAQTVYAALTRFADRGWVSTRVDPQASRTRTPRRYCRVTDEGVKWARNLGLLPDGEPDAG